MKVFKNRDIGLLVMSMAVAAITFSECVGQPGAVTLTELNGTWRGSGTDRASPLENSQQSNCRATIRADQATLNYEMVCDGQSGLHKAVQMNVIVRRNNISGTLTQLSNAAPTKLSGTVSGTRTGRTATIQVQFPGLMPTVTVELQLNSHSSYLMRATTFAGTLMDIRFTRSGR
jgi:hypothetical protein